MPKLLAEFLQEKQEPFALEVYLLERGYRNRLPLQGPVDPCGAPDCSYFLRDVFNVAGGRKSVVSVAKSKRRPSNAGEDGYCSERSSTSMFNSASESDAGSHLSEAAFTRFVKCGNCFLERGVDGDRDMKMRGEELDCKQLSPDSVLEDSSSHCEERNLKRRDESSNSTSWRCRLKQPRRHRFERSPELDPDDQYRINKRALQQKKQLMIDCTQEVMEKCKKLEDKAVLGDGEVWEYICRELWIWSQDSITRNNVVHLLHSEYLASAHEWNAVFEKMKFDICMEIENCLLEDVINDIIAW